MHSFVVARVRATWCISVGSWKHRNVDLSSLCQGCFTQHHLVLSHRVVVVVSWICILAAYWHLTNMFSSHGARHTPHRHTRTQLFRSSTRICQRSCCVRADVQPGVCAHHAFIVCVFIPRGTYFRQSFALSPFSTVHWDIAQLVVGRACTFSCSCSSSQRAARTHTRQTFNFAHTTAKVARRATSEPRKVCIASLRAVVCRVCCCFLAAFLSFGPSVPWQATVLLRDTWNVHDFVHNGTSL